MKRLGDKLKSRSKGEQLFVLMLVFIGMLAIFCVGGCGGGASCEKPYFSTRDFGVDGTAVNCGIPGLGGCISPEQGCNFPAWAQKYECVGGCSDYETKDETFSTSSKLLAVNAVYYKGGCGGCIGNCLGGCFGCESGATSCYTGCRSDQFEDTKREEEEKFCGYVFKYGDCSELGLGCVNGCIGVTCDPYNSGITEMLSY